VVLGVLYLVLEIPEGEHLLGSGHRAVVDDGRLVPAPGLHVAVHGVVAHVQPPAREPGGQGGGGIILIKCFFSYTLQYYLISSHHHV